MDVPAGHRLREHLRPQAQREDPPSAAYRLAELAAEAGLPDGVLNVVNGDRTAVDRLLSHPDVAAVSFVGSTPIARHVQAEATAHGKRVQALGGAKNHMMVLPDADLDHAADNAINAAYGSAGERCMAVSVVVAVGGTGDELVAKIAERAAALRIGPGDDPASEMGPLITREHRDKVASYVAGAADQGAKVVVDGTGFRVEDHPEGFFFLGVSLLDDVRPGMAAYDDEIFGPVLCVVRAETYDEGIALINASKWGNGAAVFTRDGGAARRFQLEVEAGMVGVNVPIPVRSATTPSAAGSRASSAICTSTATTACSSTPAARSSPPAGPTPPTAAASTSASPATTDAAVHRRSGGRLTPRKPAQPTPPPHRREPADTGPATARRPDRTPGGTTAPRRASRPRPAASPGRSPSVGSIACSGT